MVSPSFESSFDFVPVPRRRQLIERLLSYAGRVVIGVFNEEREARSLEDKVSSWGFAVSGRSEREHPHPRLAYRAFWINSTD